MEDRFEVDAKVAKRAIDLAKRTVFVGYDEFDARLDYSDKSIRDLDAIVLQLHRDLAVDPDLSRRTKQIEAIATLAGTYLGEVYRRNHGGVWGRTRYLDGAITVVIRGQDGTMFAPIARARTYLEAGEGSGLWPYYIVITVELPRHTKDRQP